MRTKATPDLVPRSDSLRGKFLMQRFILTGAPGSGKTAILRYLELEGFDVVEEAATDLIALRQSQGISEPWMQPRFVEDVANLQMLRLERASRVPDAPQLHDRSAICTQALARYLEISEPARLTQAVERIVREQLFGKTVFFVRALGFITPTAARRISFEESLHFGQMHEDAYRALGFDLVFIEPGSVQARAAAILAAVAEAHRPL
jgi:predicted ATPase